jgi:transposase-like protein
LTRERAYEQGAKKLYKSIKDKCYDQFLEVKKKGKKIVFVSDGLEHYRKGFNKFFRNVAELRFGVPIKCKKYGYKHNNNCIERDNREVKQRYHTMIGFKKVRSANIILDFFDIYDNYIGKERIKRKSKKTKKWITIEKRFRTPAERANIKLDLGNTHQFLNLINVSKIK